MRKLLLLYIFLSSVCFVYGQNTISTFILDANSKESLTLPENSEGVPAAGKRVAITPNEYAATQVRHMLYLPENWDADWKKNNERIPIIFEYTGNKFPTSGSTGEVEDAALGYALSGGKYIWVTLPYISVDGKNNQVTWWGDEKATVEYAKKYVPEIIEKYGGDKNAVLLCGFSRGAIGVNYLGLYDDEMAKLWTAFIAHDHFDGVRAWGGTEWGSPLEKYQQEAAERLQRVNGRPYLVIQNGKEYGTKAWVNSVLPKADNFTFLNINTNEVFGEFSNKYAKHEHTDNWCAVPSSYRTKAWEWINNVCQKAREKQLFNELTALNWQETFYDSCTTEWKRNWILDGKKATITHSENGMDYRAGPNRKENASHAVLWTKESFESEIKIEYEYTKIEDVIEAVTILYIQATGSGAKGYDKDISLWADKREVAAMREYFNHMNTLHISYAAYDVGNLGLGKDYIRARRYIPEGGGLGNTDLKPDYFETGLFEKDILHKITIIKKGDHLFMQIKNDEQTYLCHWLTDQVPEITEGRIGLRHMWTRGARYTNFRVSTLK